MVNFFPSLQIVIGPRSIFSLVGVTAIVWTQWWVEGTWDEKGSDAYHKALNKAGEVVSSVPDNFKVSVIGDGGTAAKTISVPEEDLAKAYPRSYTYLVGWFLFGFSFLVSNEFGYGMDVTASSMAAFLCCLYIGASSFMTRRQAMLSRDSELLRKLVISTIIASFCLAVAATTANPDVPFWVCSLGVIFILSSELILWQKRKMGETWVKEGKPHNHPVVCNMAAPLLVFGWYLLWIGSEAVFEVGANPLLPQLPIYFTDRSILAHISVFLIVRLTVMADYAHDEGPIEEEEIAAFGIDDKFFGKVTETWIPFVVCGFLFGLCSFLQSFYAGNPIVYVCFLLLCLVIGRSFGVFYIVGIRRGDYDRWKKWSLLLCGGFSLLGVFLAIVSWEGMLLGIVGTLMAVYGHYELTCDRRRGLCWIQSKIVNNAPSVYSSGYIFYTLGLILWALAVSIPGN